MKLMIVDDHAGVRNMIRQMIREPGDLFCECGTADEAVRAAADFKPDFVTMDLRMPGLGAFEAIHAIRNACPLARLVIVTSYDEPELRQTAFDAGVVGYVPKENLTELRGLLKRAPFPDSSGRSMFEPAGSEIDIARVVRNSTANLVARVEELESFPAFIASGLRSPLQTIHNFVTLLGRPQSPPLSSETQACIHRIGEVCAQMDRRINALLSFVNSGQRVVEWGHVATEQLVRQCWNEVFQAAPSAKIQFQTNSLPDVRGDRNLLHLLFINLLDNALKFSTGVNEPTIEVRCHEVAGDQTVFVVKDNGTGFDMRYAGRLFLPLSRLHPADKFPGVGLGLALARRIVQQHGGRIWGTAVPDEGAAFYFTLPCHPNGAEKTTGNSNSNRL
jgi:signal transduction histidine kinase